MSLPVRLRAAARLDYDEVADNYERQSPGLGPRFTRAVDKVLERIGRFPKLYAVAYRDVRCALVRKFPYVILYRVADDEIVVLAILPAMSNPRTWRQRAGS